MNIEDYQQRTADTAIYQENCPTKLAALSYTVLGLNGEAGEVAEKLKKFIRDQAGAYVLSEDYDPKHIALEDFRKAMLKELGGVLWYLAQTASQLDISLADVAEFNLNQLRSRKERGVLSGSGDDR